MIIKCPECGREISDKAVSCPSCGCPQNVWIEKNASLSETYTPQTEVNKCINELQAAGRDNALETDNSQQVTGKNQKRTKRDSFLLMKQYRVGNKYGIRCLKCAEPRTMLLDDKYIDTENWRMKGGQARCPVCGNTIEAGEYFCLFDVLAGKEEPQREIWKPIRQEKPTVVAQGAEPVKTEANNNPAINSQGGLNGNVSAKQVAPSLSHNKRKNTSFFVRVIVPVFYIIAVCALLFTVIFFGDRETVSKKPPSVEPTTHSYSSNSAAGKTTQTPKPSQPSKEKFGDEAEKIAADFKDAFSEHTVS